MQDYPNGVDFVVVCSVCRREAGSNFSTHIAQCTAHTALSTLEKHKCTLDTKQHKQTPLRSKKLHTTLPSLSQPSQQKRRAAGACLQSL